MRNTPEQFAAAVCPQCGGQLKVEPGQKFVECPYCGTISRTVDVHYHRLHQNMEVSYDMKKIIAKALIIVFAASLVFLSSCTSKIFLPETIQDVMQANDKSDTTDKAQNNSKPESAPDKIPNDQVIVVEQHNGDLYFVTSDGNAHYISPGSKSNVGWALDEVKWSLNRSVCACNDRIEDEDNRSRLFVYANKEVILVQDEEEVIHFQLSLDGSTLLYTTYAGEDGSLGSYYNGMPLVAEYLDIYLYDIATRTKALIASDKLMTRGDSYIYISPQGRTVAYTELGEGELELFRGDSRRPVIPFRAHVWSNGKTVDILPDGLVPIFIPDNLDFLCCEDYSIQKGNAYLQLAIVCKDSVEHIEAKWFPHFNKHGNEMLIPIDGGYLLYNNGKRIAEIPSESNVYPPKTCDYQHYSKGYTFYKVYDIESFFGNVVFESNDGILLWFDNRGNLQDSSDFEFYPREWFLSETGEKALVTKWDGLYIIDLVNHSETPAYINEFSPDLRHVADDLSIVFELYDIESKHDIVYFGILNNEKNSYDVFSFQDIPFTGYNNNATIEITSVIDTYDGKFLVREHVTSISGDSSKESNSLYEIENGNVKLIDEGLQSEVYHLPWVFGDSYLYIKSGTLYLFDGKRAIEVLSNYANAYFPE